MIILGIETSCDETAAAIARGCRGQIHILSNVVSSQIDIHKKYGGVVPEVAAREHVLQILPVINEALVRAGIKRAEAARKIKAIAVTVGPGLITSLQVGVETAKALSLVWKLPTVAIHHIEGHIYANFIGANPKARISSSQAEIFQPKFPALVLTVSGGHTMLILMRGHGKYKIIGETRDDAAGEAFDKAAKMMGLGYPGGPVIAATAAKIKYGRLGLKAKLPRPMINSQNYDFSFSGLKTALLYTLKKDKSRQKRISQYCREFQQAVIDVLIGKTIGAAQKYGVRNIMLSGGVAANLELRRQMAAAVKFALPAPRFFIPKLEYTTDNAAMIAAAGYYRVDRKDFTPWQKLQADCNLIF